MAGDAKPPRLTIGRHQLPWGLGVYVDELPPPILIVDTRMRTLLCLLIVIAGCSHPDPGISEERAKAIIAGLGFQDIRLSPEPDDWLVSGNNGPNTYRMKARVTKNGEIKDLSPDVVVNQDITSAP